MRPIDKWGGLLQQRFVRPLPSGPAAVACPPADEVRLAAEGGLASAALGSVLDHVAACSACTVAWRLVRADAAAVPPGEEAAKGGREGADLWSRRLWQVAAGLAAAGLVAGVAARWDLRRPAGPAASSGPVAVWRGAGGETLQALVGDGVGMDRQALTLRWSAAPAGSRYRLLVTDQALETIWAAEDLELPEAKVPAASLSAVPSGGRLLWRVEAILPDGRRIGSPTFALTLR